MSPTKSTCKVTLSPKETSLRKQRSFIKEEMQRVIDAILDAGLVIIGLDRKLVDSSLTTMQPVQLLVATPPRTTDLADTTPLDLSGLIRAGLQKSLESAFKRSPGKFPSILAMYERIQIDGEFFMPKAGMMPKLSSNAPPKKARSSDKDVANVGVSRAKLTLQNGRSVTTDPNAMSEIQKAFEKFKPEQHIHSNSLNHEGHRVLAHCFIEAGEGILKFLDRNTIMPKE